jgi:uncharacterized membrane protein YccC
MSLVLFLLLFAVGFLTAGISGLSFWGLFAWLTISTFVGLNPQEPVSSQTIIDDFLGLGFGMWIATIVNRLLWPILPQKVLRRSLLALCTRIKALLSGDPQREKILSQLPKLMADALGAAPQIRIAGCSENGDECIRGTAGICSGIEGTANHRVTINTLTNIDEDPGKPENPCVHPGRPF